MRDSYPSDSRHPEAALLVWLRLKPRTLGWDAWLAYDRATVNASLWHDYLERGQAHPLRSPIKGAVTIVADQHWEHLDALQFAPPVLSFEESRVSSPQVNARLRPLSGTQLTVERSSGGEKRVTRVESYTPINAPALVATLLVDDLDGSANAADQVRVDLTTGRDYRFGFGNTAALQKAGGDFLQAVFAEKPEAGHHCLLNVLGQWPEGRLVPDVVRARPFPAPEGRTDGDGAVVVMMAAPGSTPGDLPDSEGDWMYPIPQGYSTTLLLAGTSVMRHLFEPGLQQIYVDAAFTLESVETPDDVIHTLTATQGSLPVQVNAQVDPFLEVSYAFVSTLTAVPGDPGGFSVTHGGAGLELRWKAASFGLPEAPLLQTTAADGTTALDAAWSIRQGYAFSLDAAGNLQVNAQVPQEQNWIMPVYRQAGVLDRLHYAHFPALSDAIGKGVETALVSPIEGVDVSEVDRLRTQGVSLPGGRVMLPGVVHLTHDLVQFGSVSEGDGSIVLAPAYEALVAGSRMSFAVMPEQSGLTWSVEPVEGYEGDPGSISQSGEYTAPPRERLPGAFLLVEVTASKGQQRGSALLSVMRDAVAVSPLAFASALTGGKVRLSAEAVNGEALDWVLESATGATLERPVSDGEIVYGAGDRLYVPGTTPSGTPFSLDRVRVRDSAASEFHYIYALVAEIPLMGTIVIRDDAGLPPDQLQLELVSSGGPLPDVVWTVHSDGGSITPDGVYTMDPASGQPFAVITAVAESPFGTFCDYVILPIPLVDIGVLRQALA